MNNYVNDIQAIISIQQFFGNLNNQIEKKFPQIEETFLFREY